MHWVCVDDPMLLDGDAYVPYVGGAAVSILTSIAFLPSVSTYVCMHVCVCARLGAVW